MGEFFPMYKYPFLFLPPTFFPFPGDTEENP